jgi:hypothetical protein
MKLTYRNIAIAAAVAFAVMGVLFPLSVAIIF